MEQARSRPLEGTGSTNVHALLSLRVPNHDPSIDPKLAATSDAGSIADSAYQSLNTIDATDTATRTTNRPGSATTKVFTIPGKHVLRFVKSPERRQLRHYSAVLPAIQARLEAAVARVAPAGQAPWDKLVCQPMVVGKNEQDAKLHMAVLCEPALASILEEAFKSRPVQSELGIPSTTERLGYIVIPEPLEEVNAELPYDMFSSKRYLSKHDTYCGAPLLVKHNNENGSGSGVRQATFGGVIKVSFASGEARFYGMTAGHVTKEVRQHRYQLPTNTTTDAIPAHDLFSISAWLSNEDVLGRPLDPDRLPGVAAQRTRPSHDWCLFDTKSLRCNKAIQARTGRLEVKTKSDSGTESHAILIAEKPNFDDGVSDPVLILGAAAGTRRGTLSIMPASIWMATCQSFVSVYVLQMDEDQS